MSREKIFEELDSENEYALQKWGGHDFDDKNTLNDWAAYVGEYVGKATTFTADKETQRTNLIKAANLLVGAIEAMDRNGGFPNRHYEG